jgi:alpha-D-xyloside xylohydrolase
LSQSLSEIYKQASDAGLPLLRMMFMEFPEDEKCWEYREQYMFGWKYLVAPVLYAGMKERTVYLPQGKWKDFHSGEYYEGGQEITVKTPMDIIPVFEKCI